MFDFFTQICISYYTMLPKIIFMNKTVYSTMQVKEIINENIINKLCNNPELSLQDFWNYRTNLIIAGNKCIKDNKLE